MMFRAIGFLVVAALARGETADPALFDAARTGDLAKLRSFMGNPGVVNARGPRGGTALHEAAAGCQIEAVKLLVANGWDRVARDDRGATPAMLAQECREKARELAPLLMVLAAAPTASIDKAPKQEDPMSLQYAAARRQTSVVAMFLALGVKPDAPGPDGKRALDITCLNGDAATTALLLEHGANPNLRNQAGGTPLHDAALSGNAALIDLLLQHGAKIDALDEDTQATPLHYAASMGRLETVKVLVAKGANPQLKNAEGLTAGQIAAKNDFADIVAFLATALVRPTP